MSAFNRLKKAAEAFRQSIPANTGWFEASPEWQEAESLLEAGHYAEAEQRYLKMVARKRQPRELTGLARARWALERYDEAETAALEARTLFDHHKSARSEDWARCLFLLYSAAARREDSSAAEDLLREAASTGEWSVTADCLLELGRLESQAGNFEEARSLGIRAVEIYKATSGVDSSEVAEAYEVLAGYCRDHKEHEAAIKYLEMALAVRERQIGGNSSEFAFLLMTLADIHTMLGRLAPALELTRQAVGKLGPARDERLALALEKLGSIYLRTGRYQDAATCYVDARQYWPASDPSKLEANGQILSELVAYLPPEAETLLAQTPDRPEISALLPAPQPQAAPAPQPTLVPAAVAPAPAAFTPVPASPQPAHVISVQTPLQAVQTPLPSAPAQPPAQPALYISTTPPAPLAQAAAVAASPAPAPLAPAPLNGWDDLAFDVVNLA